MYCIRHLQIPQNFCISIGTAVIPPRGRGYSHTLPIRACAAQRGRDFEAPDLERGTISEAFSTTGYTKLWTTALSSA